MPHLTVEHITAEHNILSNNINSASILSQLLIYSLHYRFICQKEVEAAKAEGKNAQSCYAIMLLIL